MTLIKSISGLRGTIGGKAGETLSPLDVVNFATGYGGWLLQKHKAAKVVMGRDARPSGEMYAKFVAQTLNTLGIDVVDLGLSTTPTVEMAVVAEGAQGGIILTASHNPAGWNALKLLNAQGEFLSVAEGKLVLNLSASGDIPFVEAEKFGSTTENSTYIDWHIDQVLGHDLVDVEAIKSKRFNVVVDAVNSTGGIAVPKLLEQLGVSCHPLFCEPNGIFPHDPEPVPENLQQIASELKTGNYDLGIVVDPDVDRLVFICENGDPFGEEYTLVAVTDYVLSKKQGNTVSNLSSTRSLQEVTEKHGGKYFASSVGEVNVVAKMKAVDAVIGGEGNGGIIVPNFHYGRDALIGIALFLTHLAQSNLSTTRLRASYPSYFISKKKIECTADLNFNRVLEQIKKKYAGQPINSIDGVKIEFDKEWVHLRKSNTEPIIRIFAESDSLSKADHLAQKLITDIQEADFQLSK